jgi:hypothetical protein
MTYYERPVKLNSITTRYKVACGTLYVTVGLDKNNNPVEVFLNGGKSGGCKSNQEAIGRLTSALLRNYLIKDAYKQLKGIPCNACSRVIGELPKESRKDFPHSCGDTVARNLESYLKEKEE